MGNERVRGVPGASLEHEVWSRNTYMCSPDTDNPLALPNKSPKTPCTWTRPLSLKPVITGSFQAEGSRGERLAPSPEAHLRPAPQAAADPLPPLLLHRRWRHGMHQYGPVWVTRGAGRGWKSQLLCPERRQPLGGPCSLGPCAEAKPHAQGCGHRPPLRPGC